MVLGLGSKWEKLRVTLLELTGELQLFISFRGTDGKFLVVNTTNDFLSKRKGQKHVHICALVNSCGAFGGKWRGKILNTLSAKYINLRHMALCAWIWSSSGIGTSCINRRQCGSYRSIEGTNYTLHISMKLLFPPPPPPSILLLDSCLQQGICVTKSS